MIKLAPFAILFTINTFKSVSVGSDTISYFNWYNSLLANQKPGGSYPSTEIGFKVFTNIFTSLKIPFLIYYFCCNLVIYLPAFFIFLKISKNMNFSFFIYSAIGVLVLNFSGLRQAMAMGILFLALFFLIKRRIWSYLLFIFFVIIATLFHKSAIVFLVVIVFVHIDLTPYTILFIIPFSILFFVFVPDLFQYIYYLTGSKTYMPLSRDGVGEYYFIFLAIFAIFGFFSSKNFILDTIFKNANKIIRKSKKIGRLISFGDDCYPEKNKTNNLLLWVFLIGVMFQATSRVSYAAPRFGTQFLMFASLFIPNMLSSIKSNAFKKMMFLLVSLFFFAFFIYDVLIPNYLNVVPFSFY